MGKIIRLTENDLHRIIKNSVNSVLKEMNVNGVSVHGNNGRDWNVMRNVRQKVAANQDDTTMSGRYNKFRNIKQMNRNAKNMGDFGYQGGFDGSHEDSDKILGLNK